MDWYYYKDRLLLGVCTTRKLEGMLILSGRCFLLQGETRITEGKRKVLEECIFCSKTLKGHIGFWIRFQLYLYLHILGLGLCRKAYDSKKEELPLIHLALWFSLLGKFTFYSSENNLISWYGTIVKWTWNLSEANIKISSL